MGGAASIVDGGRVKQLGGFRMGGRVRTVACATVQVLVGGVVCLAGGPQTAVATTVVSGDKDSNVPLVIDPSTDPTDPLATTATPGSQLLMFIQKMPVTKVVDEITIGDVAVGAGCSASTASAKVLEYVDGELSGSADAQFYSTGGAPISTVPSKLTWSFSPITMHKGHGYAFSASVSGCASMTRTTWAHNAPQVNPGELRCASAPNGKRMWHQQGLDDAVWGCVDRPPGSRRFDPSMPTGWLISDVSQGSSSYWDISTTSTIDGSPAICYTSYPPNTYEAMGGAPAYWYQSSSSPDVDIYSCEWTQWANFGNDVEHGWYYAHPWLSQRAGAPRDMYFKLETIDYNALLESRAPIVTYDTSEFFRVLNPSAATDFYDGSDDPDDPDDANRLVDGDGSFASANPSIASSEGIDVLGIGYLGDFYATGVGRRAATGAEGNDYLSERGNSPSGYAQDASAMEALPGYGNRAYGRVTHDSSGHIWLQYWLYYYYDSQANFLGAGEHEGDWELVQVRLDGSSNPDRAAYAQHGGGETCPWSAVTKVDGHPVVYVALDSHASYFRSGEYQDPNPDDHADGAGESLQPAIDQVWEGNTDWVRWPGRWGDSGASPVGPAFQGSKWNDPATWADGLRPCDVS
jgi:hypothetical protein